MYIKKHIFSIMFEVQLKVYVLFFSDVGVDVVLMPARSGLLLSGGTFII